MAPVEDPDAEEFLSNVDDISMLIAGLKEGTISPEYIDRRQELKSGKQQKSAAPAHTQQQQQALPSKPRPADQQQQQQQQPSPEQTEQEKEEAEARQARLMQKVEELKASRALKIQARQRYEDYVHAKGGECATGTDYAKWDLWCPEDEEDDMFNSLTPPECKALEKDIDDRHKKMVEQRQVAERYRVAGNEAFRSGQFSEALRCYQLGVEAERTNMALHSNAAQAALKIGCCVLATEHCDKALRIAEFLHNNSRLPQCVKVYVRRAAAYRALDLLDKAVKDLEVALQIEPDNKDVQQQLAKARRDQAEQRKQKEVLKALEAASDKGQSQTGDASTAGTGDASTGSQQQQRQRGSSPLSGDITNLRRVEQLVQQLTVPAPLQQQQQQQQGDGQQARDQQQGAAGGHGPKLPVPPRKAQARPAQDTAVGVNELQPRLEAMTELLGLIGASSSCRVYLRVCGGLKALVSLLAHTAAQQQQQQQLCATALSVLNCAVEEDDGNLLQLSGEQGAIESALKHLYSPHLPTAQGAAQLLYSLSTNEDSRKLVSKQLGRKEAVLQLFTLLRGAPAQVQGTALALLSNCSVDAGCKTALQQVLEEDQKGGTGCAACLQHLAASPKPAIAERALNLIGNMCGSPQLRAALHAAPQLVNTVVEVAARSSKASAPTLHGADAAAAATAQEQLPLCVAACTALYNLAIDAPVQEAVASSNRLAHVVGGLKHGDARVVARLAGVVARCAKHPRAASLLMEMHAGPALCSLIERVLNEQDSHSSAEDSQKQLQVLHSRQQQPQQLAATEQTQALDAAVRALAVLTSSPQVPLPVFEELLRAGLVGLLQRLLVSRIAAGSDSKLGNASLCVSHIAARPPLLPVLRAATQPPTQGLDEPRGAPSLSEAQADLVAALLHVASTKGAGTASRNAGIALARMAQDPQMLLRLKELRGLEIIHATARP